MMINEISTSTKDEFITLGRIPGKTTVKLYSAREFDAKLAAVLMKANGMTDVTLFQWNYKLKEYVTLPEIGDGPIERAPNLVELTIAARKALALIDDMSRFVGLMALKDYRLFNEAPAALRRLLP